MSFERDIEKGPNYGTYTQKPSPLATQSKLSILFHFSINFFLKRNYMMFFIYL